MSDVMKRVEKQNLMDRPDDFSPGDTILVSMKIIEGDKERIQPFQGVVIQKRGSGIGKSFTVRKASGNVYVERIFPFHSPLISDIKIVRKGHVRRAKLYYLRDRTGKSTRIREEK
jgi:large subunit ribosomal protein L19